jgi:CspA family cold shock protein
MISPTKTISANAAERYTGVVKFFKVQSGYGFINPQNGEPDVFFHAADLANFSQPIPGHRVSFTLVRDAKNPNRVRASDIKLVGSDPND